MIYHISYRVKCRFTAVRFVVPGGNSRHAAGDFQNNYHNMADIGLQLNRCSNMLEFHAILANHRVIAEHQDIMGIRGAP